MSDPEGLRSFAGHLAPAEVLVGQPAGWKAALGGGTWVADLALRGALVGRLARERIAESGAEISIAGWTSARLEPEVALRLERDVPVDADEQAIWDCVGAVIPAFELVDVTAGFDDVDALLRTNIYHRAVVLGAPVRPDALDSELVPVKLTRDGAPLADTVDAGAAVGGIPRVLVHLSRVLAAGGEALRQGDVIMTGTVLAPPEVGAGGTYAGDFGHLGGVRVRIVTT